jgi:hypothetical protein
MFTGACTRDAIGECPDISRGDLVITEFRGKQDPDDTLGIWVELSNTTSGTLGLEGLKVRFRTFDGSNEIPVIVRRPVSVAGGGYVVLGLVPDDSGRPEHIDYGFAGDFHVTFLAAAAVDVEVCGELIDRARYDNLPKTGTYSFGGTPSFDNNDVLTDWCVNAESSGTPRAANPVCPP